MLMDWRQVFKVCQHALVWLWYYASRGMDSSLLANCTYRHALTQIDAMRGLDGWHFQKKLCFTCSANKLLHTSNCTSMWCRVKCAYLLRKNSAILNIDEHYHSVKRGTWMHLACMLITAYGTSTSFPALCAAHPPHDMIYAMHLHFVSCRRSSVSQFGNVLETSGSLAKKWRRSGRSCVHTIWGDHECLLRGQLGSVRKAEIKWVNRIRRWYAMVTACFSAYQCHPISKICAGNLPLYNPFSSSGSHFGRNSNTRAHCMWNIFFATVFWKLLRLVRLFIGGVVGELLSQIQCKASTGHSVTPNWNKDVSWPHETWRLWNRCLLWPPLLPGEIKQFDKGGKVLEAIGVRTPSNQSGLASFDQSFACWFHLSIWISSFKIFQVFNLLFLSFNLLFLAFVTCSFLDMRIHERGRCPALRENLGRSCEAAQRELRWVSKTFSKSPFLYCKMFYLYNLICILIYILIICSSLLFFKSLFLSG